MRKAAILAMFCAAPAFAQPLSITLTGQSMIRSDIRSTAPAAVPTIKALLGGDVVFTNFEGTVFQPGQSVAQGRGFLAPPAALDALHDFGFNLLALAGNHAFDLKASGIANTLQAVTERGIVHAGTGNTIVEAAQPAYLKAGGATIALVASASGLMAPGAHATESSLGVNELRIQAGATQNNATQELPAAPGNTPDPQDSARILANIRTARSHADIVIVYQHNHVFSNRPFSAVFGEGLPERLAPPAWLVKWVHEEIDAGADIVVMHGAPLLHGIEIYRDKPIFYDLGSFIYNLPPAITYIDEPIAWESVVANLTFDGRKLQSITLKPIALNQIGEGQPDVHDEHTANQFLLTRGLPKPATGTQANDILERLARESAPFGTGLAIHDGVAQIDLSR